MRTGQGALVAAERIVLTARQEILVPVFSGLLIQRAAEFCFRRSRHRPLSRDSAKSARLAPSSVLDKVATAADKSMDDFELNVHSVAGDRDRRSWSHHHLQ